jgi:outer membrane biosynthesis protein TonB
LQLSISEKALIKKQIEDGWRNIPVGAQGIEQAKVVVYISLDKDGTVLQVKIVDTLCNGVSAGICQALADSALRAVKQASPLKNLPVERYDTWKEFQFLFDPSEILK